MAIALVGIADRRGLEESEKFRARFGQLDHAHVFRLFGPAAIDEFLPTTGQAAVHKEREAETENESPPLESAEEQRIKHEEKNERLPDIDVTDRSHEEVERRPRPLFVDQMKERLIHRASLKA